MAHIIKVGLAVMDAGRILLVRKRGAEVFILPGGKPEAGEDDLATLHREIDEELGCRVEMAGLQFEGAFTDQVAGKPDTTVTVRLYRGTLIGEPQCRAEIEELRWIAAAELYGTPLAPSLTNQILPVMFGLNNSGSALKS